MTLALQADQVQAALVRRVIENLVINGSWNTQVVIRQNTMVGSDDGAAIMQAVSDITVDITVSGVNGLDTGVEAPNTWYYIYLIWNPTSGLVRGLLSVSPSSPILPSGYTKKRLVGAVRNDGSGNFSQFTQHGKNVFYKDGQIILDSQKTNPTYFNVSITSYVPHSDISRIADISFSWWYVTGAIPDGGRTLRTIPDGTLSGVGNGGAPVASTELTAGVDSRTLNRCFQVLDSNLSFSIYQDTNSTCWFRLELCGFVLDL